MNDMRLTCSKYFFVSAMIWVSARASLTAADPPTPELSGLTISDLDIPRRSAIEFATASLYNAIEQLVNRVERATTYVHVQYSPIEILATSLLLLLCPCILEPRWFVVLISTIIDGFGISVDGRKNVQ
jgi:hypothetical protein